MRSAIGLTSVSEPTAHPNCPGQSESGGDEKERKSAGAAEDRKEGGRWRVNPASRELNLLPVRNPSFVTPSD